MAQKAVCHPCTKLFLSHHCHITAEMLRNALLLLQPRKEIKIHYIYKALPNCILPQDMAPAQPEQPVKVVHPLFGDLQRKGFV